VWVGYQVELSADGSMSIKYTIRLSAVSSVGGMLLREGGRESNVKVQM